MSLLRSSSTLAGAAVRIASASGARALSTSAVRKASAEHDHDHAHPAGDSSSNTNETFLSPIWRNTLIASTLLYLGINYLPSPPSVATSPSSDPHYSTESTRHSTNIITKTIQQLTPPAQLWKDRNEKHLEQSIEVAQEKLLFQEAERPKIRRLRNPGMFENASPHNLGVGTTVDLSDLNIKSEPTLVVRQDD